MTPADHLILFVTGLTAASFSTLIGGGTLLTVPVLILLQVPAHTAVATNRIGVFGLAITGWVAFQQQGLIRHSLSWALGLACGVGAIFGTMILLSISEAALKGFIAAVSVLLLIFTALQKEIGVAAPPKRGAVRWAVGLPLAVVLGAYGSVYGAGLGTFLTYLLVILFGQTFLQSAGTRKVAIGMQAIVSSILYYRANLIHWPSAANLFVSMGIGSYRGARYGTRLGNVWIRRAFMTLAAVLSLKILL